MHKIDKIYFDIDGVISGTASPEEDIIALLHYCLDNYAGSLYWLTTHCKNGENHTYPVLSSTFPRDLADELYQAFQPTDWGVLKTDAIDLACDFVWFDDNLFESEKAILESHYILDSFFKMNPKDPAMAKKPSNSSKASRTHQINYSWRLSSLLRRLSAIRITHSPSSFSKRR